MNTGQKFKEMKPSQKKTPRDLQDSFIISLDTTFLGMVIQIIFLNQVLNLLVRVEFFIES